MQNYEVPLDYKEVIYHEVTIEWNDGEKYNVIVAQTNIITEEETDDDNVFFWVLREPYLGMRLGEATVVMV